MAKRFRSGLGLAALLCLVACEERGGEPTDSSCPPDDSGRDAAPPDPDAAPPDPDPDAAQPDAEGPAAECGSGIEIAASEGGEVASENGKVRLVLAPDTLAEDATVRVCLLPAQRVPAAAHSDQGLGEVYLVEADAAFQGTLVFSGEPLPAPDGADPFEPLTARYLESADASPATLGDAVLTLAASTRLSATLTGNGYVYLKALDATAQYNLQFSAPKTNYLTGEIITLGARVEASGTPAVERSLAVEAVGCGVETIEPVGVTQADSASADCSTLTTVVREDDDLDGADPLLVEGRVVDLTDADAAYPPPSFFCKFPRTGKVSTRLRFVNGGATELSVERELAVTCTYSGDLVSVFDATQATRNGQAIEVGAAGYVASYGLTFTSNEDLASYRPFGADGRYVISRGDTRTLVPNEGFVAVATGNTLTATPLRLSPDPDAYYVTFARPPWRAVPPPSFYEGAGGVVAFTGPASIDCPMPSTAELGVEFGPAAKSATAIAFDDGVIDALHIAVLGSVLTDEGEMGLYTERWIDPAALPLVNGKRTTTFLSPDQLAGVPEETRLNHWSYRATFLRVRWDEQRAFWPGDGGRIVPVGCGVLVQGVNTWP